VFEDPREATPKQRRRFAKPCAAQAIGAGIQVTAVFLPNKRLGLSASAR
jgi:hypothetical protein